MENYYDPASTEEAARLMLEVANKYRGNNNFEYDLVDIVRQALADRGRIVYNQAIADFKSFDKRSYARHSKEFLNLLLAQDKLLATRSEFRVGKWINQARSLGNTPEEKKTCTNGMPVCKSQRGATGNVPIKAAYATMPTKNGTAS